MSPSNIKLLIMFTVLAICVYVINNCSNSKAVEKYRDPVWMNKSKLQNNYYTRSNGSIYGQCGQPFDMFSGYPSYPKAY